MKIITVVTTFFTIAALGLGSAVPADSPATKATTITGLTSMPLAFTENQGQWDEQVLFRANAGGATMWFTKDGAYYQFIRHIGVGQDPRGPDISEHDVGTTGVPTYRGADVTQPGEPVSGVEGSGVEGRQPVPHHAFSVAVGSDRFRHEPDSLETMMIKADYVGSNPTPRVVGEGLLEYKCNYFLGNDPAKWRTNVPNYSAVVYEDIYPGIDLKYYGNGKQMEYDFIVSPGTDPSQIMVQYEGAKSLSVDAAGRLVVETDWGEVVEQRPVVYQLSGSNRVSLAGEYVLKGDKAFGFELGSGYDRNLPVVIDPVLEYSTYLGGNHWDYGSGIAVDTSGAAYVTGWTDSPDFPTENPYQTNQGGDDVFVTKLSNSGSSLVYSTYLGGNDRDQGNGIAVDDSGAAYVTGYTYSTDFPTVNPYQTDQDTSDVFVVKLSSAGNSLIYSTYLGGSGNDYGWGGIAVDSSGAAYVTGYTESTDFPTENPYQTDQPYSDAFVTKLSSAGNNLIYSTYLGGNSMDGGSDIAVDAFGSAYVTGETYSTDFPTENPYQIDPGLQDVFVTKLSSSGSSLVYSTYLGGNGSDFGHGIAVDASGAAYVTGYTWSTDFPTENPYQETFQGGEDDVFVTRLNSFGDSLVYSTYLGGSGGDQGCGIAVDNTGCAYVMGRTWSTDFPTENPYQTDQGGYDAFVTKLSSSGNNLIYSTYLGGSSGDRGYGIAVDNSSCAYVTGYTLSTDFPTLHSYQTTLQGYIDAFVTKLYESCCNHDGIRGDVDYSGSINIADAVFLVEYIFFGGPPPPCPEEGDADGDGSINIADAVHLVEYIFFGGPAPPPCP